VQRAQPDEATRASSTVTRDELRERLSRSAPEALRWVPGVSVQQTTHGQGSPYVRGVTGQQVLLTFDGIRLNNGIYRQGPNQYFFTVDLGSLDRIEVQRGSASTRWGADAIGGVVLAMPSEPTLDPRRDGLYVHGRAIGRFGTQSPEILGGLDASGRLELDAQLGRDVAILVGGGYRGAEPIQGSGVLTNPSNGQPALVPFVEADGRTQRGTGFRYGAFDARLVARVAPELRLIGAVYGFRQYDTPRADLCPPPIGFERDCTTFLEQFRTLAYVALRGSAGPELREVDVTVSYQRQHEVRELREPSLFATNQFRDDVDSVGLAARLGSRRYAIGSDAGVRLRGGGDVAIDFVRSSAFLLDSLLGTTRELSRGLYADHGRFYTGGLFAELDADAFRILRVRSGVRAAFSGVRAPAEPLSATQRVHAEFEALVARAGLEVRASDELGLFLNVDQGFRAPNLDDMTSRQIIGPGYQFENPALTSERAITYELGARLRVPGILETGSFSVDAWLYAMEIEGAMTRSPRGIADCPAESPECRSAFSRFQLVNVVGRSWVLGAELASRLSLPFGLGLSATLAYAWGEGPSPLLSPTPGQERVPLSRIMPVNGTVELRYANAETHLVVGAAMRWAGAQDRLAISDGVDARIPLGGTPAYAAFDLRAGWRFEHTVRLQLSVVLENVFDQVYRVHGSGINGAGRGLVLQLEGSL
jgi:iron complex outermembrane receptor protein/hemoglobin/transferrin/lactoferrin receptor protein